MDCGEPIAPARQQLGAQLCLECQKAEEAQASHFRKWHGAR
jgi:RNA polymerase-binding transcription factor DksA